MSQTLNLKMTSPGHDDQVEQVNARNLTMITHQGGLEIEALDPDVMTITAEDTIDFVKTIPSEDWLLVRDTPRFRDCWHDVWKEVEPPLNLQKAPLDMRHIVGMICLIYTAVAKDKRPFVKLPETYMHPAQQSGLGTMFSKLASGGEDESESTTL